MKSNFLERTCIAVIVMLLALAVTRIALAQSSGIHVTRWSLSAMSGGVMTSNSFRMAGTGGQPVVGLAHNTSGYQVGGIWPPHPIAPFPYPFEMPDLEDPTEIEEMEERYAEWMTYQTIEGSEYFPTGLDWPGWPDMEPLDLPDTLGLPEMPTVEAIEIIDEFFDAVTPLSTTVQEWGAITTRAMDIPESLAEAMGVDISGFESGEDIDVNIEIGGYTADEMVDEMVTSIATPFQYIRAAYTIPVIGPTIAFLMIGILWIALIELMLILIYALFQVIHDVKELFHMIPFIG